MFVSKKKNRKESSSCGLSFYNANKTKVITFFGSVEIRSLTSTMEIAKRTKSSIKGKITRMETYIENINNETDSTELKVKLKTVGILQNNIQEVREKYYCIPNINETELIPVEEELNQMEDRLETCEIRIETAINSYMKTSSERVINEDNNKFEIKTKIPPLVVPKFSGKYEEFSAFKVHFDDLNHK